MTDGAARQDREEARRREALDALGKLRERDTVVHSALVRAAKHFAGSDAVGPDGTVDPVELWGRRIGRALSLLAVIALSIYLYWTYLR
jgi:hypothetical protein